MTKFKVLFYLILFVSQITFSQEDKFDKIIFQDLYKIRCNGYSNLHTFVNKTNVFHLIEDKDTYATSYKLNTKFNYNFFITVFNVQSGGFRINSPNPFIFNYIIDNGKFVEIHKEGNTSFLVYEFNNESFLLNNFIDSNNREHYIVDFWCIK